MAHGKKGVGTSKKKIFSLSPFTVKERTDSLLRLGSRESIFLTKGKSTRKSLLSKSKPGKKRGR